MYWEQSDVAAFMVEGQGQDCAVKPGPGRKLSGFPQRLDSEMLSGIGVVIWKRRSALDGELQGGGEGSAEC
jgi:hypothetical protein